MPFLERDADLARLKAMFEQAKAGDGRVALIAGEAGIGKTTFVEHFTQGAGDALVLQGHCEPLITPSPMAPVYDMARQFKGGLPRLLDSNLDRVPLFSAILEELETHAAPLTLIFEDIHWADEATLTFIKYLGRRVRAARMLVMATYRDDEVRHNAALRALLGAFANERAVERFALKRLSIGAVRSLAQHRQGVDVDALHERTGGNPFFVHELIAQPDMSLPVTVSHAVLARSAQLEPEANAFLELLAVIGPRIDSAVLAQTVNAEACVAACVANGLLTAEKDGVAFRHAIVRDAVLDSVDPLRRKSLSRKALTACVRAATGRSGLAQLAQLAEDAGDADAVLQYAGAAAEAASNMGAHREANAQYARLIRFASKAGPAERARYRSLHADACVHIDNLDAAIAGYRAAAELWLEAGDGLRRGETLANMAWPLVRQGQNSLAEEAVAEAIALLEPYGETPQLGVAFRIQAHLRMLDRDRDEAIRLGERAIALSTRFDDRATAAAAEIVVGSAKLVSGEDDGRAHIDRAMEFARSCAVGGEALITLAYSNLGSSYGEQYHFAAAEQVLAEGIAFAQERDLDHHVHYMMSWLAMTRLFQGRWSESAELAETVLALPNLAVVSRIMALVTLGRVRARSGAPGAVEVLDEALDYAETTGTLQRLAPVRAARAELAWLQGDAVRTAAEAMAAFDLAARHRHRWHVGELSYWRTRAGDAPPHFVWAAVPYAAHLAGDWRSAADAWDALGCPYERARALADGDEDAQLTALETFEALTAAPAAADLRRRMRAAGIRRIPRGKRASTMKNAYGLTSREVAILREIAEGLTNSEIGNKLFISPKTVDHHVSAILSKLAVATRREAAEIARQQALLD